jgi:hypothetical protein
MTSSDSTALHDLLSRVASGEIDPADAARLLDEDATAPTLDHRDLHADSPVTGTSSSVTSLAIAAGGIKLIVVADPTVATAVAEGPYSLRQDGSTLIIEAPTAEGFQVQAKPRGLGWVPAVFAAGRGERVTVRVNPDLPLTLDATACSVDVTGVHADLTLTTTSSSVRVREHRGALHGSATMSNVAILSAVTGASSFLCEFGSLNLRLEPGSDVAVTAVAELGSLKVAGARATQDDAGLRQHAVVGIGSAPFDLTVRMGSATVVTA